MHKNVNINNKILSLVFYRVIKAASIAGKKFHSPTRAMIFFLQCWLPLSPYKAPEKAFYYLNNEQ
jgi:hypothetical protein